MQLGVLIVLLNLKRLKPKIQKNKKIYKKFKSPLSIERWFFYNNKVIIIRQMAPGIPNSPTIIAVIKLSPI